VSATYELVIDWMGRPLVTNKANKMHWAAVGRERTAWGDAAIRAAQLVKLPKLDRVTIEIEPWFPDRRSLPDPDGLAPTVKGIIDGLVRGGYLPDDSGDHITGGTRCLPVQVDRHLRRHSVAVRITEDETNGELPASGMNQ